MSTLNSERLPATHRKRFNSKALRLFYGPFGEPTEARTDQAHLPGLPAMP
jgi:hypothetical protein